MDVELKGSPLDGKYGDVLLPFVVQMEHELHANAGKGDRPGWLRMTPDTALLEIYYHLSKLQKAVRDDNGPGIQEYAADVANMSMMLLDICGGLALIEYEAPQVEAKRQTGEGMSYWAVQMPGKMPKLYGAHAIAELNWYPDEGGDLVRLQEVERIAAAAKPSGEVES